MYNVQRELALYADNACIVCLLRNVKQVKTFRLTHTHTECIANYIQVIQSSVNMCTLRGPR
jgi:hypothetical protein